MNVDVKHFLRAGTALVLATMFAAPGSLVAQAAQHVVGSAELNRATVESTSARQQNRNILEKFVSSEKSQQALKAAHMNPEQVKNAVANLSDGELAQLASRVQKAQSDFAAGTLTDRDLIIILVAIAALILIIVAVR